MITAAHIGVGIRGVEGQQSARAADQSLKEFKELRRLLFYHGRECYRRNSVMVCYTSYKNILVVLPQFWYGILSKQQNEVAQTQIRQIKYIDETQLINIFANRLLNLQQLLNQ